MNFSPAYSLKNNEVTLTNCDREPVHIPGCIQPHGVLIALDPDLTIRHISQNSERFLGQAPETLLGQNWAQVAQGAWETVLSKLDVLPRYVLTLTHCGGQLLKQPLDILAHMHQGRIILEGEPVETNPALPLERAYAEVNRIVSGLQHTVGLQDFCHNLAIEIRALTGLDRVMIYRFHEDHSGEVFAEAKRDDLHPYLTLRYPSEDIPQPAREIFRKIWTRPVPDIDGMPVEITPLLDPTTQQPLDMTYCGLRGASVMYTDYLKNMGVAAALTLSILVDGQLWGLVACHHYAPKHIAWPVRAACELLAQVASLKLKSAEQNDFAQYRDKLEQTSQNLIDFMIATEQPVHGLLKSAPGLLDFIEATGVAVFERGIWHKIGLTPKDKELNELGQWLQDTLAVAPTGTEVLHTNALDSRFAPAHLYRDKASGLLAVPISRNARDLIIWFRPEVIQTVNWAGDPHSKLLVDGPGGQRLMPRASFALWQEQVAGQALPWQPAEIEMARRLRLSLMEVAATRTENVSHLNRELEMSNAELDAFAYVTSHDLREPLRGIYHYGHYLQQRAQEMQDTQSIEQTDHLLRLTKRMDNLIESLLHFSRVGRTALDNHPVNMHELAKEAIEIVRASRPEKNPEIDLAKDLPQAIGDRTRLREIWLNLLANAVKYSDSEKPRITIGACDTVHGKAFFVADDGIGIDPAFHNRIFDMFKRLHGKDKYGGGSGAGLSIVKKIVERHGGTIWVDSALGQGTRFYFTLDNDR